MTGRTVLEASQDETLAKGSRNSHDELQRPQEDDRRKESLLRRSQGRWRLQQKYMPSFESRRNDRSKHLQMHKQEIDDSTMTTWSESTEVSQTQQGMTLSSQLLPSMEACQLNLMKQNHDDSSDDGVDRIHDKYVVRMDETNETFAKNSLRDSKQKAFCGINACDGEPFACYRTICSRIEEFRWQQPDKNHPSDRDDNNPKVGSIHPKKNGGKDHILGNVKSNEWDFTVEPVGGPINLARGYERNRSQNMLVGSIPDAATNLGMVKHVNLSRLGNKKKEKGLVMSSVSIVLRKRFGINMTLPTRLVMLRRALLTRRSRFVASKAIFDDSAELMVPSSRARRFQIRRALYQGKKEASLTRTRIFGGLNCGDKESVLPHRMLYGLMLMHAMGLINEIDCSPKLVPRANQNCRDQKKDSNGLPLEAMRSTPTIPSLTDSSTCESQIVDIDKDELLLDFVPPGYICNFEHALEETTDLSATYVNAHNSSKLSVAQELDDDNMEKELANLESIELILRCDLELSAESWINASDQSRDRSEEPLTGYPRPEAVLSLHNSTHGLSSDINVISDDVSLDWTESSFDVQDARRAVLSVMKRLKGQIPVHRQSILEKLGKMEERLLDDLDLISRGSPLLHVPYQVSDAPVLPKWLEVCHSTSSISELTLMYASEWQPSECNEVLSEHWRSPLEQKKSTPTPRTPSALNEVKPKSGDDIQAGGSPGLFKSSRSTNDASNRDMDFSDKKKQECSRPSYAIDCENSNSHILHWRKRRSIWGSLLTSTEYKANHRSVLAGFSRTKELVAGSSDEHDTNRLNNSKHILRSSDARATCSMENDTSTQKTSADDSGEHSAWSIAPVIDSSWSSPVAATVCNDDVIAMSSANAYREIGSDCADSRVSMHRQSSSKHYYIPTKSTKGMGTTEHYLSNDKGQSRGLACFELEDPEKASYINPSNMRKPTTGIIDVQANVSSTEICWQEEHRNFHELCSEGELGVEAFLLYDEEGKKSSISDISGSTDVAYTDSESSQWSTSLESSSLEGIGFADSSESKLTSLPISVVRIGLKTAVSATKPMNEDRRNPPKQACDRNDIPRLKKCDTSVNRGVFPRLTDIRSAVVQSWKCTPTAKYTPELAQQQIEEELWERLRGIKHY
jgi:hypothetical protein